MWRPRDGVTAGSRTGAAGAAREEPAAWACWLLALAALLVLPAAPLPALLSLACGALALRRMNAGALPQDENSPSRVLARVGITAALAALVLWAAAANWLLWRGLRRLWPGGGRGGQAR